MGTTGNVGIGTTSPVARLEVNGTAQFDSTVTFAPGQSFSTTTGTVSAESATFTGALAAGSASVSGALLSGQATFAASNFTQAVSIDQTGTGMALTAFSNNASLGVFASANSTNGVGIEGSIGVALTLPSQTAGVLGINNASTGIGVEGVAESASGVAGVFQNTASGGKILSGQAGGTAGVGGAEVFAVGYNGSVKGTTILPALNTVSFSASPTFDASLGNTLTITLTNNVASSILSNATAGQTLNFIICQGAGGPGHSPGQAMSLAK